MSAFPLRLRQLRNFRGVTQAQLAEAIGVTDRACRRYEAGENEPTLSVIQGIADYFDVSADYLMGRDNYWQDSEGHIQVRIPPDILNMEKLSRLAKKRRPQ